MGGIKVLNWARRWSASRSRASRRACATSASAGKSRPSITHPPIIFQTMSDGSDDTRQHLEALREAVKIAGYSVTVADMTGRIILGEGDLNRWACCARGGRAGADRATPDVA